jgi:hypothetical protein
MQPRRKIIVVMLVLYCLLGAFIFLPAGIQRTNNQVDLKTPLSNQAADFYSIENCSGHMMSPDGTKVAYLKNPDLKWYNNELWVADRVPGSAELVNHMLISSEVAYGGILDWKGDWILYKIQREGGTPSSYYGKDELWRIKYDGTSKNQVTFTYTNGIRTQWWNHAYDNRGTVAWGCFIPGTDKVYFYAHDGNGWYESFVCNTDGTDDWYRISYPDNTWRIAVSPTGNRLLWGAQWDFGWPTNYYSCNIDGSDRVPIKEFTSVIGVFVCGDGDTVVWHENNNIYAIKMDGTGETIVIDDQHINQQAGYDPSDPQGFFMRSNRTDGNFHLYKIKVDGTIVQNLTDGPYNDEAPRTSSDGKFLSYLRLPAGFTGSAPYPYELVIIPYLKVNPCDLLEDLKQMVIASPDNCWTGNNYKGTMDNKIAQCINLCQSEEYGKCYDKLLHDIKPKLTGIKADEEGHIFGNGIFNNPWINCSELQQDFASFIDDILVALKEAM